jgi:hypothetical protein
MQINYRKKPVVIEAMQFTYPPTEEFLKWFGQPVRITKDFHSEAKAELDVSTLEDGADNRAKHIATEGDWIIRGVQGEMYPIKPDIFAATYELV